MNKRILCLVLALVMVLGAFSAVFAAESKAEVKDVPKYTSTDQKIQWLQDNGIVSGRKVNANGENNDLALDKTILRGEVTKLLVYAIGKQDLATQLANVVRAFKDVEPTHWANGYIAVGTTSASPANGLPFLNGYPDGTFHADWNVNYAELAKMLVVLTKKDLTPAMVKSANANWPSTWLTWAAQGGILDGVKYVNSADNAVRKDAFAMIYNALYAMKEWRLYPTSETIGVISAYKPGKLYLNSDAKKEYVVNENTYFVPASSKADPRAVSHAILWSSLVTKYGTDYEYYLGSLVRVITNDKNEVTHIIQLGNPDKLDLETQGWAPIADGHLNGSVALRKADLTVAVNGNLRAEEEISVDSKTRYFVADYAMGQFAELANMNEVRTKLFKNTTEYAERVYLGFEKVSVSGRKVARLVVFNKVDKNALGGDLVRVSRQIVNNYNIMAQKPGQNPTEELAYNLGKYNFYPYGYTADLYDVVKLNAYNGTIDVKIDYSKDNIYQVKKVERRSQNDLVLIGEHGYRTAITLSDGYREAKFGISEDTTPWFGNQLVEGAFVQATFSNEGKEIDLISVVPATKTRGDLKVGTPIEQKEVVVIKEITEQANDKYKVYLVTDKSNNRPYAIAVFNNETTGIAAGHILKINKLFTVDRYKNLDVYTVSEQSKFDDRVTGLMENWFKAVKNADDKLEVTVPAGATPVQKEAAVTERIKATLPSELELVSAKLDSADDTKVKVTVKEKLTGLDKTIAPDYEVAYK